ncbi:hypothetical protein M0805_007459 [Coniferiporia weirii]|nr:hypothetical protein M0805_007459 [Coniferiporia weirii]
MTMFYPLLAVLAMGGGGVCMPRPEYYVLTDTQMVVFAQTATVSEALTTSAAFAEGAGQASAVPGGVDVDVLFLPLSPDPDDPPATPTPTTSWTSAADDAQTQTQAQAPLGTDSLPTSSALAPDPDPDAALPLQTPVVSGPLISAYYPDWALSVLPPEKIDMSRLSWIDFAFVSPDENFNLVWDDPSSSPGILSRLVSAAHAKGTKVKLSIGGWDGSRFFSLACATAGSRQKFVNNIVAVYNQFHLDGIDIDWEYPGQQGAGNNKVSPQDSANFLATLQLLRARLPKNARITAAVQDTPFVDPSGNPMRDVSAFAAVLDWVNIMNYDVFTASATPGPNAPLSNGCHDSSQPNENAAAAIAAWSAAKFPAGRLMLGVPAYGYINPSKATTIAHKRALAPMPRRPLLRRQSVMANLSISGVDSGSDQDPDSDSDSLPDVDPDALGLVKLISTDGGQIQFNQIVAQGALRPALVSGSSSRTFLAVGGFTRFWDTCSTTPFMTSPYEDQVVTYDDPQSLTAKAAYAKQAHILGTAMWDLSGDTAQWDLTDALRRGLGMST